MIVVGGAYLEECASPRFAGLVGPGLRAAMALSGLSDHVHLHTVAAQNLINDIRTTCQAFRMGVTLHCLPGGPLLPVRFSYGNALRPLVPPPTTDKRPVIHLGERREPILLLELLEAEVTVVGRSVVYEPETLSSRNLFTKGISRAARRGLVLKAQMFRDLSQGRPEPDVARDLSREAGAEVLVVRSELGSATVFQGDLPPEIVGPYETRRWHRLGMGNVFSAVFAYHWAERQAGAGDAAREACLAAAQYNEGGGLPFRGALKGIQAEAPHLHVPLRSDYVLPRVRLEGCNTRYVERQLFFDANDALEILANEVETRVRLSDLNPAPIFDDDFSAMLVLTDFADNDALDEAARAAVAGKPVISYREYSRYAAEPLERIAGVETVDDFITAIYRTAVAARRQPSRRQA